MKGDFYLKHFDIFLKLLSPNMQNPTLQTFLLSNPIRTKIKKIITINAIDYKTLKFKYRNTLKGK